MYFVKVVLRLDGRSMSGRKQMSIDSAQFAGTSNLGVYERAVISKYGGDSDNL